MAELRAASDDPVLRDALGAIADGAPRTNGGAPSRSKRLYFVRHGQSEHNASLEKNPLSGDEVLELYVGKRPPKTPATRRFAPSGGRQVAAPAMDRFAGLLRGAT